MRTKNSLLNMITNLLPGLIIPIISLIKLNWLLNGYGIDIYGMNLYLTQVMGYLNLVEGGFGFAFVQALYKPLADGDKDKVRELYYGANFILKIIGVIILGIGLVVCFALPVLMKTTLDFEFVRVVLLLMVFPTVVDYFLMGPSLVMQADQKEYILNIIRKSIQIIRALTHLFIIYKGYNYLLIPLVEAIYIIIQVVISRVIVFKYYPWLKQKAKKDLSTLSNAKQVFAHRLAGVVLSSTDSILLTSLIGTHATAIFGNYVYITGELQKILESIINAPKSSFGNLFASDSENSYKVFKEFFSFSSFIATCVCTTIFISINDFIGFWQNEQMVLTIVDAGLFSFILYFILVRQPIMIVRDANGLFKESKKFAYMEALFNFIFSFIAIYNFGITGALIVTFFTYLISDLFMNSKLVYKKVFSTDIKQYYKMYISKILIVLSIAAVSNIFWNMISVNITNLFIWFIFAGIFFTLIVAVTFVVYFMLFNDFKLFIVRFKTMLVSRKSN